jgi:hypothetical protein
MKRKMEKTKKEARRTSGRIRWVPQVVEITLADSGDGAVIVGKIEEASVVVGEASVVDVGASVVAAGASAVARGVSVVASEGASGIVMVEMALEGGGGVSGVGAAQEEIGEDLERALKVNLARKIPEDSRRGNLNKSKEKNIEFGGEILKVSVRIVVIVRYILCMLV